MSIRLPRERVNFFDGQKITENDLDVEQINNLRSSSEIVEDFHGSGVLKKNILEKRFLFDSTAPGKYGENLSKEDVESGRYDGKPIYLDRGVSDVDYGTRVVFELSGVNILGGVTPKILIVGRKFDGVDDSGYLTTEIIEFTKNTALVSKNYYKNIVAILMNNFSGGIGQNHFYSQIESENTIGDTGKLLVYEAEDLSVFPDLVSQQNNLSPNFDIASFITSDVNNTIQDEIASVLIGEDAIESLFIDLDSKEKIKFLKNENLTKSFGQKFLAKTNNIQRVDILLSVEKDTTLPLANQFDWSGQLIVGIHKVSNSVKCITDSMPEDRLGFDPELSPIVELSFDQDDFKSLGYILNDIPQKVSFNFSNTIVANPNLFDSIKENEYFAFIIRRSGSNSTGNIVLEKGYDSVQRKKDLGLELTTEEQFKIQDTRYVEFDPIRERFVDDVESSLWFKIYSSSYEIISGQAYDENGELTISPKTIDYVGGSQISYFDNKISPADFSYNAKNYVLLENIASFTDPDVHPLTGNRVFTRIKNLAKARIVDAQNYASILQDKNPILLATIQDNNLRDDSDLTGALSKPGEISHEKITIIDPGQDLLNKNLIGQIFTPDTECMCNSEYRIVDAKCSILKIGDINKDKVINNNDINKLLEIIGNTLGSSSTQRKLFNNEFSITEFVLADLNGDSTVDGEDLELLDGLINRSVTLSIPETINVLELTLENINSEENYPTVLSTTNSLGFTTADTSLINISVTENEALAIRVGDFIDIESTFADSGTYIIQSKNISNNFTDVELSVVDQDGNPVTFLGSSSFNVVVRSFTKVNLFANNMSLLDIPYVEKQYRVSYRDYPYSDLFINICDQRRFVESSFIEQNEINPCVCTDTCDIGADCEPTYKNQYYFPGDIYIPDGNILSANGIPHHGDYEFATISMPLPPGTINNCSIDIYNTFIAVDKDCKTKAGFPAMKFSDGSFVGCDDIGSNTDLSKGRVKIEQAIASLYVDASIDGYGDGYGASDFSEVKSFNKSIVSELYENYFYNGFSTWADDSFNDVGLGTISKAAGVNQPAIFDLTTLNISAERFLKINTPAEAQNISGDFIIDVIASRVAWPQNSLLSGKISAESVFEVLNTDGSSSVLRLGWMLTSGNQTKIFYSGIIKDSLGSTVDSFNYMIDAPDSFGDNVQFRLRRTDNAFFAYYIVPGKIGDTTSDFGDYIRIGSTPTIQPGDGLVNMSFGVQQENSPTAGVNFVLRLESVDIKQDYVSDDTLTNVIIGKDAFSNVVNSASFNIPLTIPNKTNILSAKLIFESRTTSTITDSFTIAPFEKLNLQNIGKIFNIPLVQDLSTRVSFIPGNITTGGLIEVDIYPIIINFISNPANLPGFFKGLTIYPSNSADSSFVISNNITLLLEYEDITTGVVFKVGVNFNPVTGIATFNTKNILYDALIKENRTVLSFGVHLKKAGFKNADVELSISDLEKLGIGLCRDESVFVDDEECFFIVGSSTTGTLVEGPFPCNIVNN